MTGIGRSVPAPPTFPVERAFFRRTIGVRIVGLKAHLFTFMHEPVAEVGSYHKVAAWSIRIQCWFNFVMLLLVPLATLGVALLALFGSALWGSIAEEFGWRDGSEAGAAVGAFLFVMIVLGGLVATLLLGLWLWWSNVTYRTWNRVESNAIVWANIFGAVLLLLGISNAFGQPGPGGPLRDFDVADALGLVIGVLILVFSNLAHSQGELEHRAPDDRA